MGVGKRGRRSLLNELLEAALGGAIAGAEHAHIAVRIGQHLGLDVARVGEELLHVALGAAESLHGLAAGGVECALNFFHIVHDLQAASAAAISSLDGNGQAVLFGKGAGLLPVIDGIGGTRCQRRADLLGHAARSDLVTEQLDGLRGRANPDHAGLGNRAGKVGVLGQEAVARVDGIGTGTHRDIEQRGHVHVGIGRGIARQRISFIRYLGMQGTCVCFGVNGDGLNAQVAGDAGDTHGNLAAVSNEDGLNLHSYLQCSRLGVLRVQSSRARRVAAARRYQYLLPIRWR